MSGPDTSTRFQRWTVIYLALCSSSVVALCFLSSLLSVTFTDLLTSSPALGLGHPPAPAFIHGSEGFNSNVRGVRSRSFPAAARLSARTVSSVLLHLWSGGLERKREYWCIAVKCMRQDGRGWERRMGERGREGAGEENRTGAPPPSKLGGRESHDVAHLAPLTTSFSCCGCNRFTYIWSIMRQCACSRGESHRLLCQNWPTLWILDFVNVI